MKVKEGAWRAIEVVFFAIIAMTIVGTFVNWFRGVDDGRPKEGQPCGPAHHWIYQRSNVIDLDLSCEPD
jgi:hypothetical protein